MLWSMAGNLAMVHRVFMGMSFTPNGIKFNPVIPKNYSGTKILSNFKYRKAILDITVKGFGNSISSIKLDGKPMEHAFLPATVSGNHHIEIIMDDNDFSSKDINLVENQFSLPTPLTTLTGTTLKWNEIKGAVEYQILKNGDVIETIRTNLFNIKSDNIAEYKVIAVDKNGVESFSSEPVMNFDKSRELILEAEIIAKKSDKPYSNFTGEGFVEISTSKNKEIIVPVSLSTTGKYLIDLRYSNGTGPWNTDNNCAIRSLYVNNNYEGVLVFPQRGTDEWSNWGYSNSYEITLNKGKNVLKLKFEEWNTNMDGKINEAMIDYIRLVKTH